MKTLTLGAAVLFLSLAPAYADTSVVCVQHELATRGFDPGPVDGQLGVRTLAAAQAASIVPLTSANAGEWCRTLRPFQAMFSLSAPVPAATASARRQESPRAMFRTSFNSPVPLLCASYVIDSNDPCF